MSFDPAGGSKPTQVTVKTGTLAVPPGHNPVRAGFRFDGWTYDGEPFDFQTPILQDMTMKAQWTKITDWTLNPEHGPATGAQLTISQPKTQEPQFADIQAAGDKTVGLTGDGRIYTWAQDSTPKQIPSPAQAPDGFHYLQATAGSRWQAALGSDQRIYTWNSQQSTPIILDIGQDTKFASISMSDDRLLAVDRQGRIHAFQDSRNTNQKPLEQASLNLSGKEQAITAVASDSHALIMDADGQVRTWDTSNTGKAKTARIKQQPDMRIVQAQALDHGFLLLDADGQAWYLPDGTVAIATVDLPKNTKTSRITANDGQAVITDTDGHVWAWKPDNTPVRAENGNQQYMQAAATGSRITAIGRQGDMLTWSLDGQGRPGKPARLGTTQVPTLESASMDGQPLKLGKTGDAWQAQIPARKPGPATILITGRQDGQPFTKNLKYTVDQTLTRDAEPGSTYKVTFDTDAGSKAPDPQQVSNPYGRVKRPSPDPTRQGFLFDGWFIGQVAYDFSKPVTENLTLTAKWTRQDPDNTWRINPDKGSQLGKETTTITPPANTSGIKFNQISASKNNQGYCFSLAVGSDGNAYAWGNNRYGQLGDGTTDQRTTPVMVKKPDSKIYKDLPLDFTYVQVNAGGWHSLALGNDGYVYAWGYNNANQLGYNTSGNYSTVPVRVHDPNFPTDTNKGLKAIQVSAGYYSSLAVGEDGTTWAWGDNGFGLLGNNSSVNNSSIPVRVCDPNFPTDTSKGLKAIQVSAGSWHSLAVGEDGTTWAWGENNYGQLGNNESNYNRNSVPVRVRDPVSPSDANKGLKTSLVSGGGTHSLAIDKEGNIWAWGRNDHGELGAGKTNGGSNWNENPVPQKVILDTKDASTQLKTVLVSAGEEHSLAVGEDGTTWAWGLNNFGQIGNNTMSDQRSPVKVFAAAQSTSLAGPWLLTTQVSAGGAHSLAIDVNGKSKAWGDNQRGELGNPDPVRWSGTSVPVAFHLQPVISAAKFDTSPAENLNHVSKSNSVTVTTPEHLPGTVTVSVDYTLGGAGSTLTYDKLQYTYLPAGTLPHAGGEGIMLALATGTVSVGGVLASRRHRRELHRLWHTSHE